MCLYVRSEAEQGPKHVGGQGRAPLGSESGWIPPFPKLDWHPLQGGRGGSISDVGWLWIGSPGLSMLACVCVRFLVLWVPSRPRTLELTPRLECMHTSDSDSASCNNHHGGEQVRTYE
ncbi:hypothetical protein IE53DRAFT_387657 [Violaceomyces palustris]|uniref:Uncharacterized protein n=1 Tax=Violaceomyces palustris TaxID=1673888 RepID=A0ACD0NW71_9BASI|nr:hypothetical protein IE53DRAFT_387657 [Violaceomyces palustris]